ncbi:MAG: SAM-dependent methyltransferase, partial [Bacteroidales bacterium]|nr:SAM-dependent methyltransferase [Bacteroidales bacterium]
SLGRHVAKDNITYYAQELKENTYNLTRMNLVMRSILPSNIVTRCADSLDEDWPIQEEGSERGKPLYVDAVVSNPPYSQEWDPEGMELDSRFKKYGLAPKKKADYAFLLHELHHLKPNGILTIVLPHGVLFRGDKEDGSEGQIRMNLIETNNIDAIIGLPAGIFFGTPIATIIMILKQRRDNDDVLIIDASKGFVKDGKQNRLRACDIKRIADTYRDRADVPGFSRKVSRDEIRQNDYNLNIPRYVDSSEAAVKYDIYATMFGGIPNSEIDDLNKYWQHLTSLRADIFESAKDKPYSTVKVENIKEAVTNSHDVQSFNSSYLSVFSGFEPSVHSRLIDSLDHVDTINESREIEAISADIFSRMQNFPIINVYDVYQVLADKWDVVAADFETFQQEYAVASKSNGSVTQIEAVRAACRAVDQAYKMKKEKDGTEVEVPDGLKGRIMPFELIQKEYFAKDLADIQKYEARLEAISSELDALRESLSEDDADELLNDDKTDFDDSKVLKAFVDLFDNVHTPAIDAVRAYIALLDKKAKKNEKLDFLKSCTAVNWTYVEKAKDGTVSAKEANALLHSLYREYDFPEDSVEQTIVSVVRLNFEEKDRKETLKLMRSNIEFETIEKINNLTDDECLHMLHVKWIDPIMMGVYGVFDTTIASLCNAINALAEKYAVGLKEINKKLGDSEDALKSLISELTGDEFSICGLNELIKD